MANIKEIVSRANLTIDGCVNRSEGGIPIGNGVMGTLVWTSPTALKTQINRVDVYANASYSNSFNERHFDYGYGCAFLDIDFANFSADVFDNDTKQFLDIYSADAYIKGKGVDTRFFACEGIDAFVFSVDDKRENSDGVAVKVKMLRPSEVQTKSHFALSSFIVKDDIVILKQEFTEDDYYCASAVAVKVSGKPSKIRYNNESGGARPGIPGRPHIVLGKEEETEMRICLEPGSGNFDVYVASAASFSRENDPVASAVDQVVKASGLGVKALKIEQEKVWKDFWEKSYVELWGDDDASLVETHYNYFMYIMGCCSKNGNYAPNFGGLLFSTRGDFRHWGVMQWWNSIMTYYNAIPASGRHELLMPYLKWWLNMRDRCAIAARQNWNAEGIYFPETAAFDGPETLPDDIASELADLMLVRKDWSTRSQRFIDFYNKKRPHESLWNFMATEKRKDGELLKTDRGMGPFGPGTHMIGSQAGVAFTFWQYFRYSGDMDFFKEYGYPVIKGVTEFFLTFPNIKLGEDGKYHVYHTSCGEEAFDCTDSLETLSAMHGIFPVAIKAAEMLGKDADFAERVKDRFSKLAPMPTAPDKGWINAASSNMSFEKNVASVSRERGIMTTPCRDFDLCTLETKELVPEYFETGMLSIKNLIDDHGTTSRQNVYETSPIGRVYASMGWDKELGEMLVNQINCINAEEEYCYFALNGKAPRFENRLTSREGINAMNAMRLGNIAAALQLGLLQSAGGSPASEPVIRLFPTLPARWDARFALYASGGFKVEASREKGVLGQITITSQLGNTLRVRGLEGKEIRVNGVKTGTAAEFLEMPTNKGDVIVIG